MRDDSGKYGNELGRYLRALAALLVMSGAVACSDSSTDVPPGTNELSFAATTATEMDSASNDTSNDSTSNDSTRTGIVPVTKNGHTLDLSVLTVNVQRADLKRSHNDDCGGDDANGDDPGSHGNCAVLKLGGANVDLPLSGTLVTVQADSIPGGTFNEIEVLVADVHLRGTYDSTAFDIMLPLNVKADADFTTPINVTDGTPTSITVDLPIIDWLTTEDGSLIDPSIITSTPALLAQLKLRFAATIRAFEDSDHDNRDDHITVAQGN